ncbi:hypothetical protein Leryth_018894 [Lithospermum erythrorhizon]|nr:hypothetical protein Leryth_018894 [Lithospermum erythrorhizon]
MILVLPPLAYKYSSEMLSITKDMENSATFLGFVATNLWAVDISHIERVISKIPSICNGVLVEKVIEGSSFDSPGLLENDVIVQCGGSTVHSFMEFFEMLWDNKVGDVLQLGVVRGCENELIHVNMVCNEVVQNFIVGHVPGAYESRAGL